jgi:hypothetical protein
LDWPALALGAFLVLSGKAETPDTFTRHGLPIPGAYFKNKESQQPATVAVSKSGKGVGEKHKSTSQPEKKAGIEVANFQKAGVWSVLSEIGPSSHLIVGV